MRQKYTFLTRKIHVSWLIMWMALGVVIGLSAAVWTGMPIGMAQIFIFVCATLFIVFRNRSVAMVMFALAAGVCLGTWRGSLIQTALHGYEAFYGKYVSVHGVVNEETNFTVI